MQNIVVRNIIQNIRYCFFFKEYPLHNKDSQKLEPFFIVGSGRSGNTLLRRILNNHTALFIPPETYEIGISIEQFKSFNRIGWTNLVKLIYANFQFNATFDSFKMNSLDSLCKSIVKCELSRQSMAHILDAFYLEYRKVHDIKSIRWGDKTPLNTFYMEEILEVFPQAKFVHIIRDPYDAIYSYVESGIYSNYTDAAMRWRVSVEKAKNFSRKYLHCYYELEYENLVDKPEIYIIEICHFLEINYEKNMLKMDSSKIDLGDVNMLKHHKNVLKPISKKNIGKGLKKLTKNDLSIINTILGKSKEPTVLERIFQ